MRTTSTLKYTKAMAHVTVVMSQLDALAVDEEWQATLAALPKGVMHRN
jgi:hypothetical protein